MRVTVCELSSERIALEEQWSGLVDHCRRERPSMVLLPEMPFAQWLAASDQVNQGAWMSAVIEHESWRRALLDLVPATIIGTEPIVEAATNYNEGFVWSAVGGRRAVHRKHYLPNEPGFWEASWYERGPKTFEPVDVDGVVIGFLICTEMWFTEHARSYAKAGVDILAAPRATGLASADKWLAGGRAAAVMSGAFCLSSNRSGVDSTGFEWGGHGWVIEPEEGDVLGVTSPDEPFLTVDINLEVAVRAKSTYPRYVEE
jgi:N-carbamoylputrescine amidase